MVHPGTALMGLGVSAEHFDPGPADFQFSTKNMPDHFDLPDEFSGQYNQQFLDERYCQCKYLQNPEIPTADPDYQISCGFQSCEPSCSQTAVGPHPCYPEEFYPPDQPVSPSSSEDQINQINQVNQINQIDHVNQINQSETDEWNTRTDEANDAIEVSSDIQCNTCQPEFIGQTQCSPQVGCAQPLPPRDNYPQSIESDGSQTEDAKEIEEFKPYSYIIQDFIRNHGPGEPFLRRPLICEFVFLRGIHFAVPPRE